MIIESVKNVVKMYSLGDNTYLDFVAFINLMILELRKISV